MQCVICKVGITEEGFSSFTVEKEGRYLIFSKVPAAVCNNCGEAYFSAETTEELLEKANQVSTNNNEVEVIRLAS